MLEIGTIVYLKKGNQKLMIISRGGVVKKGNTNIIYDYSACLYPTGYIAEQIYYFNEENVDCILHRGLYDEDEKRFQDLYKDWVEKAGSSLIKGRV